LNGSGNSAHPVDVLRLKDHRHPASRDPQQQRTGPVPLAQLLQPPDGPSVEVETLGRSDDRRASDDQSPADQWEQHLRQREGRVGGGRGRRHLEAVGGP
jgi:hypothetical protein